MSGGGADDGNDELTKAHPDRSEQEESATTHLLNHVQTRKSRDDIDEISDEADEERVIDTGILEELCAVVEDEVDTRELLERLQATSRQEPLDHVRFEAVRVSRLANTQRHLVVVDRLDLVQLGNEARVVDGERA